MKTLDTEKDHELPLYPVLMAHRSDFLRFVERRVGKRDVAEDILQETLTQSLEKISSLREREAVRAWFYRALRNATVDYHRRARRGDRVREELRQVEDDALAASPEAALSRSCGCATRAADSLKPEYADALRRVEVEGASLKVFAAERGISAINAGVRVSRARAALRRALLAVCGAGAAHGCGACGCETGGVATSVVAAREHRHAHRVLPPRARR